MFRSCRYWYCYKKSIIVHNKSNLLLKIFCETFQHYNSQLNSKWNNLRLINFLIKSQAYLNYKRSLMLSFKFEIFIKYHFRYCELHMHMPICVTEWYGLLVWTELIQRVNVHLYLKEVKLKLHSHWRRFVGPVSPSNPLCREYLRVKYHCTVDLLFDWFGFVCFANKNRNCQLWYSWFQTSQTGGQGYSDTSPFSIPCLVHSDFK